MKPLSFSIPAVLVASLAVSTFAYAQAPSGSTGECKDGTYTTADKKSGACSGHGGVKAWYAADKKSDAKATKTEAKPAAATPAPASAAAAPAPAAKAETKSTAAMPAPAAAAATPPPASAPATSSKAAPKGMPATAAAGGGPGKVWVNTSSHVYHCSGDEWYGKTKAGEYMTEADAKAKGAHAAHGKACG